MTDEEKKHDLVTSFCRASLCMCEYCPFSIYFAERHNVPRVECYHVERESMTDISMVVNLWCGEYDAMDNKLQQNLRNYKALDLFNGMTGEGVNWV